MNSSKLADYSEILSSIAIIATLIYLAIEISQNTDALESQTRQAVLDSAQSELTLLMENPELPSLLLQPGELSPTDNVRLDSFLTIAFRSREFSWLQYQDGAVDEDQWATERAVLVSFLDSTRVRLWWERMGRHVFGQRFVDFIDSINREVPATDEVWRTALTWSSQNAVD